MLKLTALTSPLVAACSTSSGGLGRGHRQRLLADHVPAGGEDRLRLGDVEIVRRGDVDDLDRRVLQEGLERRVGARHAQGVGAGRAALGRAAEHAAHLDADAAQLLDVDGPDEARADDRGADVGDPPHDLLTHLLVRAANV